MNVSRILAIGLLILAGAVAAQEPTAGEQWDKRFDRNRYLYGTEPVEFLREQIAKLPKGKALCLAAGEGRNAVYLAEQGYDVTAMDASPVGLEKAVALAKQRSVTINTEVGDLQHGYEMGSEQYDLITDFYYHDTGMLPGVMRALKPGGMFILQNFSIAQLDTNRFGPKNPDYLAKPNEMLSLFPRAPHHLLRGHRGGTGRGYAPGARSGGALDCGQTAGRCTLVRRRTAGLDQSCISSRIFSFCSLSGTSLPS